MACKYCQHQKQFETKDNFPYITKIVDGTLIVSKWKRFTNHFFPKGFFRKFPVGLYCVDIKYCPMCGEDLSKVKSIGNKHIVE